MSLLAKALLAFNERTWFDTCDEEGVPLQHVEIPVEQWEKFVELARADELRGNGFKRTAAYLEQHASAPDPLLPPQQVGAPPSPQRGPEGPPQAPKAARSGGARHCPPIVFDCGCITDRDCVTNGKPHSECAAIRYDNHRSSVGGGSR
jgi:hypothetical protein